MIPVICPPRLNTDEQLSDRVFYHEAARSFVISRYPQVKLAFRRIDVGRQTIWRKFVKTGAENPWPCVSHGGIAQLQQEQLKV